MKQKLFVSVTTHMQAYKNKKTYIVAAVFGLSLFGVVTRVDGSTFVLDGMGRDSGIALTANIESDTVFKKDGATDPAGNLAVGQHVLVMGQTSADAISAKSVNIITHEPTKTGLKHVFKKQK